MQLLRHLALSGTAGVATEVMPTQCWRSIGGLPRWWRFGRSLTA